MTNFMKNLAVEKTLKGFAVLVLLMTAACAPLGAPQAGAAKPQAQATPTAVEKAPIAARPATGTALLMGNKPGSDTLQIETVDLISGKPDASVEAIEIGKEANYAFSPDRSKLAVTSKFTGCHGTCLRIFELASMRQTALVELPYITGYNEWVSQLAFDPQGKQVVLTTYEGGKVTIVDFAEDPAGKVREGDLGFQVRKAVFTPDGKQVMLVGVAFPASGNVPTVTNPQLQALLIDAKSLQEYWRHELPDVKDGYYGSADFENPLDNYNYLSGMAADVDSRRIYIAHADSDKLTTVDFQKMSVKTVDIHEEKTAVEEMIEFVLSIGVKTVQAKTANNFSRSALLSADKRTLYVVGYETHAEGEDESNWEIVSTPYGLEAWEIDSGKKLLHVDTDSYEMRQSPDGKILIKSYDPNETTYHPITEIFDPVFGKITARLEDTAAFVTLSLDGNPLLVSSYFDNNGKTFFSLIDGANQKQELFSTRNGSYASWLEIH